MAERHRSTWTTKDDGGRWKRRGTTINDRRPTTLDETDDLFQVSGVTWPRNDRIRTKCGIEDAVCCVSAVCKAGFGPACPVFAQTTQG